MSLWFRNVVTISVCESSTYYKGVSWGSGGGLGGRREGELLWETSLGGGMEMGVGVAKGTEERRPARIPRLCNNVNDIRQALYQGRHRSIRKKALQTGTLTSTAHAQRVCTRGFREIAATSTALLGLVSIYSTLLFFVIISRSLLRLAMSSTTAARYVGCKW